MLLCTPLHVYVFYTSGWTPPRERRRSRGYDGVGSRASLGQGSRPTTDTDSFVKTRIKSRLTAVFHDHPKTTHFYIALTHTHDCSNVKRASPPGPRFNVSVLTRLNQRTQGGRSFRLSAFVTREDKCAVSGHQTIICHAASGASNVCNNPDKCRHRYTMYPSRRVLIKPPPPPPKKTRAIMLLLSLYHK